MWRLLPKTHHHFIAALITLAAGPRLTVDESHPNCQAAALLLTMTCEIAVRLSAQVDQPFRSMLITRFGPS